MLLPTHGSQNCLKYNKLEVRKTKYSVYTDIFINVE